jgi:hypothetical protein
VRAWALWQLCAWVFVIGCDRGPVELRELHISNMPSCPRTERYAEPLTVRIDREPTFFEHRYSISRAFEAPIAAPTVLIPRQRMHGKVRVGLCPRTSLGTADCNAARWLAEQPFAVDDRAGTAELKLPTVLVGCASGR